MNPHLPRRARARGFTLIEMMIALTLGLIILAALTTFFMQSSANRAEMERGSRQIENGRFAMNVLREDIALAGFYYDITQKGTNLQWQSPDACMTTPAALGFANSPIFKLPLPIFGYANRSGAPGGPLCVVDAVDDTDVLVIRRFNTEPSCFTATPITVPPIVPECKVAAIQANQFYVQASHCRTDTTDAPIIGALGSAGSSAFTLREHDCSRQALLWRYREHVYYVRKWSMDPSETPRIPTLVRLELDNGTTRTEALVEGIQAMRIEYGLDTNGDGAPDDWRRCNAAPPGNVKPCALPSYPATGDGDWPLITAIRVYVLSANTESSLGYRDQKTYDMGQVGTLGPYNDQFKRHVYTAVVNATNRSGLLER